MTLLATVLLTLLLLVVAVALVVAYYTVYVPLECERYYKKQGIKSTGFRWLVGNIPEIRKCHDEDDPFRFSRFNTKRLGNVFISFFGPYARLMINSPPLLQEVLVKKGHLYGKPDTLSTILSPLIGNGLFLSEGEMWKRQRALISPAFHFVNLKKMTKLMLQCTLDAMAKWQRQPTNSGATPDHASGHSHSDDGSFVLEAHHAFSNLTLEIIVATSFGSAVRDNPKIAEVIYSAFTTVLQKIQKRNHGVVGIVPLLAMLPFSSKFELDRKCAEIKEVVVSLLHQRRAGTNGSLCEGKDLLDLLLEARDDNGHPMPEALIKDELMTFVLAGHETTSNLMAWALWLLSTHPECMALAQQEVDREMKMGKEPLSMESLKTLHYCDAALDEALRLMPPAPMISRCALTDHTLGGYDGVPAIHIRKGMSININIRSVHENADYWPEPSVFQPQRFLDKREGHDSNGNGNGNGSVKRHPLAFIPFAAGPRSCIGSQFAKLEAKVMLATILQRFTVSLVPGQRIVPSVAITMRPKYGLLLKFVPRGCCANAQ